VSLDFGMHEHSSVSIDKYHADLTPGQTTYCEGISS
jgi:hypothetical protein